MQQVRPSEIHVYSSVQLWILLVCMHACNVSVPLKYSLVGCFQQSSSVVKERVYPGSCPPILCIAMSDKNSWKRASSSWIPCILKKGRNEACSV